MAVDVWLERAGYWRLMRCLGMRCLCRYIYRSIDTMVRALEPLYLVLSYRSSATGGVHAERS